MKVTGIICEYNPFHLGHFKQFSKIKEEHPRSGIVCLMSGNFVQRGMPAIFDKQIRANAAVDCGADLVLELPLTASLSSAEGFASEGVRILGTFCDALSFGAEDANSDLLLSTANALLSEEFKVYLKAFLAEGLSFPSARQRALQEMGMQSDILAKPNNILGVEYCKAILSQKTDMKPSAIFRGGNYHDITADAENPSASSVRHLMESGKEWQEFVPVAAIENFKNATIHRIQNGEAAILYRLRTMSDAEYEALPYGSEGLWRKLMNNAREYSTLEEILASTKSKRYTRTRLDRMVMCAFLGLSAEDLRSPAPYTRVLAFNDKGRQILLNARENGLFPNIGERVDTPYQALETRSDDLYGFFVSGAPEAPGITAKRRVYYCK